MRKRVKYYKSDIVGFALGVQNPYEPEYNEKPYCLLRIQLLSHSWWIKIPELFEPKKKWIDTSNASWNENREKPCGYMESIRKDYGISMNAESIHVQYGIQPGSWSRDDPENSDHSKVFWWPWRLEIVRHDLLYPNGDVYWRNLYPRKGRNHIHWWEVFEQNNKSADVQCQVAEYVKLDHWTKDGKNQKARIRLCGEVREWRPKWTRWLPMFKYTRRVVDCQSDVELGTKAGSWKGGMIGWSVEWREDESMKDAFWRWYKNWDGQ